MIEYIKVIFFLATKPLSRKKALSYFYICYSNYNMHESNDAYRDKADGDERNS